MNDLFLLWIYSAFLSAMTGLLVFALARGGKGFRVSVGIVSALVAFLLLFQAIARHFQTTE